MQVRSLTAGDAREIASWRYPGRYATYNVAGIIGARRGFWAVGDARELIGYCCFGAPARVPGAIAEPGVLDVGYGIRPDLVGKGLGRQFVGAVIEFAVAEFESGRMRLLILDWNERSRRVALAQGFRHEGVVRSDEGDFVVMIRA